MAARFGVTPSLLNLYGVRARPAPVEEKKAPKHERMGRGDCLP
jgi:hypothetical protein